MQTLIKEGRVTPKYKGYFVSIWKKVDGINTPYRSDEVDKLIVKTIDGDIELSREYLIKNKILSNEKCRGKLGFRIKENDKVLEQIRKI